MKKVKGFGMGDCVVMVLLGAMALFAITSFTKFANNKHKADCKNNSSASCTLSNKGIESNMNNKISR